MSTTTDEIIASLQDIIDKKLPMSPQFYLEQAQKLVVLMGEQTDLLHSLYNTVAKEKVIYLEEGKSAAESRMRVETTENYKNYLDQKAKIEQINEIIRISKIMSRAKSQEMSNYSL